MSSHGSYPHPTLHLYVYFFFLDAYGHIFYHLQEQPPKCECPCSEPSVEASLQQVIDAEGQSMRTRGQRHAGGGQLKRLEFGLHNEPVRI